MIITPYGKLKEKTFSRPMFVSLYLLDLPWMITIHWRMSTWCNPAGVQTGSPGIALLGER
jgi:hypothetical protein